MKTGTSSVGATFGLNAKLRRGSLLEAARDLRPSWSGQNGCTGHRECRNDTRVNARGTSPAVIGIQQVSLHR
jgi:hypothetical protein